MSEVRSTPSPRAAQGIAARSLSARRIAARVSLAGVLLASCAGLATAQIPEPILVERNDPFEQPPRREGSLVTRTEAAARPGAVWFVPRFVVDQQPFAEETTLWAVQNVDSENVDVEIKYVMPVGDLLVTETETFRLAPGETKTRNVASVPNIGIPLQRTEGHLEFRGRRVSDPGALDGQIVVDNFRVDSANDFATGDIAHRGDTDCRRWTTRFLSFGDGPSQFTILTDARGTGPADPPTLTVYLFDEAGMFLTSFDVYSKTDSFDLDISSQTNASYGRADFDFGEVVGNNFNIDRAGFVDVNHSAFGRFSVGHQAFCYDPN